MSDMISGCPGCPPDDASEAAFMQRQMILMQRNPVVTSFHVGEGLAPIWSGRPIQASVIMFRSDPICSLEWARIQPRKLG